MKRACVLLVLAFPLMACPPERLFPDRVGMGVARLSVRNAGNVVAILQADTTCGFASPAVLAGVRTSGELGGEGTATWTVQNCRLDLGEPHVVKTDCNGVETHAGGAVTVSATKTLTGLLTGNPENPVIPTSAEAARFDVQATFEGFVVRSSDSNAAMKIQGGSMTYVVQPHLAVSVDKQVCSIPTADTSVRDLRWQDGSVVVESDGRVFDVTVEGSELQAQVGRWQEEENALRGSISVWGTSVKVPTPDDKDGLDPEYNAEKVQASVACTENLQQPISYACPSLDPRLAEGAARLSVSLFGALVSAVNKDDRCGFAASDVVAGAELSGEVGQAGGSATFRINTPCTLEHAEDYEVSRDCAGVSTTVKGKAVVTGTRTMQGILTGQAGTPVVPTSRDAVAITLEAELTDFTAATSNSTRSLTALSGRIRGTLKPRLALDASTGACSLATPVVEFQDLTWTDARLLVTADGNSLQVPVATSNLDAQNGAREGKTNHLSGTMKVRGADITVPLTGNTLNPDYHAETFDASYACTPNLLIPADDVACSFNRVLAENSARLTIRSIGAITTLINTDSDCGFENTWTKLNPDDVQGEDGEQGSMSWSVEGCEFAFSPAELFQTDCSGGELWTDGYVNVDAERTVQGLREKLLLVVNSIKPNRRDSVQVRLTNVELDNFSTFYKEPGTGEVKGQLIFHSGTLSAVVQPYLGERADEPGVYDISLPVSASTSHVQATLTNVDATLLTQGKTFHLQIAEAQLDSHSGNYNGYRNVISGTVRVNGELVTFEQIPLDPTFDEAAFIARYACVENLKEPIPPQE
ncbi:MAG: hypothetical protein AB2A00_38720 [Myxococcota bacterium]